MQRMRDVRKTASQWMASHPDDFLPFIDTSSGELLSPDQYAAWCKRVHTSDDWGGQLELRALSAAIGCPILLYAADDAPQVCMGEQMSGPTLKLSYHRQYYALGEHYNSVVPAEEPADAPSAPGVE